MSWAYHAWHLDLNVTNRPVRTRMPGGVGGEAGMIRLPYPDFEFDFALISENSHYIVTN
jgi:hypothetical protein